MNQTFFSHKQQGYFLFIAVIFIMVMGMMGVIIVSSFSTRAWFSVAQLSGNDAFYVAETGLQIGARSLSMPNLSGTPNRLTCGAVNGNAATTNATYGRGSFTLTSINSSPIFATSSLSSAITASSATITVASIAGFAPNNGKIIIDKEAIEYGGISGNSFVSLTRGVSDTMPSSHASGAAVSQYLCSLDVSAGVPSVTAIYPSYKRELQMKVQLQDGWIAGSTSGTNIILSRWNRPTEKSWNLTNVAGGVNTTAMNAISMLSNAYGWAVGNTITNVVYYLIVLQWNGTSWVVTPLSGSCPGVDMFGISMVSSQDGFAVGRNYLSECTWGGNRFSILRWNGSIWYLLTPFTSPSIPGDSSANKALYAVSVIDTTGNGLGNIGFAVGAGGTILRYNGSSWTQIASPTVQDLRGVYMVSATQGWAVGSGGVILYWNGTAWSLYTSPTTAQLNSISMMDTNNDGAADAGFAAGNGGVVLRFTGSAWTSSSLGTMNFRGVDMYSPNDAWAVGTDGAAWHWDGSTWTSFSSGTTVQLNGISLIRSGTYPNPTSGWRQIFK